MPEETVPSLTSEEPTPAERPPVVSKSEQKRRRVAQGLPPLAEPVLTPVGGGKLEDLRPLAPAGTATVAFKHPRWRVVEDREVPSGAASFLLHREQVLSEQHFDVPKLLALGVKLERLPD